MESCLSSIVGLSFVDLEDEDASPRRRLDAAVESGLTTTGANGSISYIVWDGREAGAENAAASNNVDTDSQAREDAASLSDYAKAVALLTIGMLFWPECRPVRTIRPTPMLCWPISTRDDFSICPRTFRIR